MSRDPRVNLLIHGLPVDRPNYAGDGPNYATISGSVSSPTTRTGVSRRCTTCTWAAPAPSEPARNGTARIVPHRIYLPTFAAIFGAAH